MADPSPSTPLPNLEIPLIGAQAIESGAITGACAALAVGARLYTKIIITKAVGWDDYFSGIALVFALARVITQCVLAAICAGPALASVSLASLSTFPVVPASSYEVSIEVLYLWAILFAKLSILALYIQIFGQVNRRFRRTCYAVGAVVMTYCVTCTPLYVFSCLPSGARTLDQLARGRCVPTVPLNLAIGALNIATDSVLMVLPIPPLLKLQMTWRRKIAVMGVFGTGTIAWASSVGREWLFLHSLSISNGTSTEIYDILWLTTEMNVGIVAGCLPVLQPLFQRIGSHFRHAYALASTRDGVSRRSRHACSGHTVLATNSPNTSIEKR